MTIFIDTPRWHGLRKTKKLYCHMFAATTDELHAFATVIGRKPAWFHRSKNGQIPHYDLDDKARTAAIANGAIERTTTKNALPGIG